MERRQRERVTLRILFFLNLTENFLMYVQKFCAGNILRLIKEVAFRTCSAGGLCLSGLQIRLARKFLCVPEKAGGESSNYKDVHQNKIAAFLGCFEAEFLRMILKAMRFERAQLLEAKCFEVREREAGRARERKA